MVFLGVTGRAVVTALLARHHPVLAIDDHPSELVRAWVVENGIESILAPELADWPDLLEGYREVVVSPGIPDRHPVFRAAELVGASILDESDLAATWDRSEGRRSLIEAV